MKASNFVEKLSLFYIFALTSPLLGDTHGTPGKFACSHESFVANNLREEGGDTDGDELAILTNREDVPVTCEGDKEIHTLTARGTSEEIDSKISVLTASVQVNGEPVRVRVRVGESIAIAHPELLVANNQRAEGGDTDGDGDELAILTNREDVPVTCEGDKEIHTLTGPRCTSEEIDSKISDVEVPKSVTCAFMDNKFIRAVVFLDGQPVVETTEGSSVVVDGETRKRKYCKRKNRKGQDLDGQLKNQDT